MTCAASSLPRLVQYFHGGGGGDWDAYTCDIIITAIYIYINAHTFVTPCYSGAQNRVLASLLPKVALRGQSDGSESQVQIRNDAHKALPRMVHIK